MAMTMTALNNNLRNAYLKDLIQWVAEKYDVDAISVASGAIAIPAVDEEGNEKYVKFVVSVPRGSRNGKGGYNEYNAYDEHDAYQADVERNEAKHSETKAKNEAKRKADDEKRAMKKALKNLEKAVSES